MAIATWEMTPFVMVPATIGTMAGTYFTVQAAGDIGFGYVNENLLFPTYRQAGDLIRENRFK